MTATKSETKSWSIISNALTDIASENRLASVAKAISVGLGRIDSNSDGESTNMNEHMTAKVNSQDTIYTLRKQTDLFAGEETDEFEDPEEIARRVMSGNLDWGADDTRLTPASLDVMLHAGHVFRSSDVHSAAVAGLYDIVEWARLHSTNRIRRCSPDTANVSELKATNSYPFNCTSVVAAAVSGMHDARHITGIVAYLSKPLYCGEPCFSIGDGATVSRLVFDALTSKYDAGLIWVTELLRNYNSGNMDKLPCTFAESDIMWLPSLQESVSAITDTIFRNIWDKKNPSRRVSAVAALSLEKENSMLQNLRTELLSMTNIIKRSTSSTPSRL